jgi:hypothetical protein
MDKYPLHRTGATGYNATGKRTRYVGSTVYPLPRSKGKEGEGEMKIYLVICNGKVSSEAYRTLKEAEAFCESRGAKKVINRWLFTNNDDVYQITDVQVDIRTPQNDEVRE